ncbi:hypothetical protein CLOM621_07811 [Clostridium sp. M62/1]|nr:hypothetical protein CLOM621_07811 [Clostridium sp. M62/1]
MCTDDSKRNCLDSKSLKEFRTASRPGGLLAVFCQIQNPLSENF